MVAGSGTGVATLEAEALAVAWPLPAPSVNVNVRTSVIENGVPPGTRGFTDESGLYTSALVPAEVRLALAVWMGVEPEPGCPKGVFVLSRKPW